MPSYPQEYVQVIAPKSNGFNGVERLIDYANWAGFIPYSTNIGEWALANIWDKESNLNHFEEFFQNNFFAYLRLYDRKVVLLEGDDFLATFNKLASAWIQRRVLNILSNMNTHNHTRNYQSTVNEMCFSYLKRFLSSAKNYNMIEKSSGIYLIQPGNETSVYGFDYVKKYFGEDLINQLQPNQTISLKEYGSYILFDFDNGVTDLMRLIADGRYVEIKPLVEFRDYKKSLFEIIETTWKNIDNRPHFTYSSNTINPKEMFK